MYRYDTKDNNRLTECSLGDYPNRINHIKGGYDMEILDTPIGTGTRIKEVFDGYWMIRNNRHGEYYGSLNHVVKVALNMGLQKDDLEYSISEMGRTGHNVAEFGMFGTFLYTHKEDNKASA